MSDKVFHLHLVSDATGETINSVVRAGLVQFEGVQTEEHFWSLIRTRRQLDMVMEGIRQWPGMVLYTFVDKEMQRTLADFCRQRSLPSVAVLDPVLNGMAAYFGKPSSHDPGRQHVMDADYFARIEAMDYALALDDGNRAENVAEADVLILGVSRTSKTPTCLYLANRGIRAANIPIVPGVPLGVEFEQLTRPLIVGLTKDPESLVEIRRSRLRSLQQAEVTDYVDPEKVAAEVTEARRLFARLGCPVIDVTNRSIEETAAEIIMLLSRRALAAEAAPKPGAAP